VRLDALAARATLVSVPLGPPPDCAETASAWLQVVTLASTGALSVDPTIAYASGPECGGAQPSASFAVKVGAGAGPASNVRATAGHGWTCGSGTYDAVNNSVAFDCFPQQPARVAATEVLFELARPGERA
jgi:hypothetical protein